MYRRLQRDIQSADVATLAVRSDPLTKVTLGIGMDAIGNDLERTASARWMICSEATSSDLPNRLREETYARISGLISDSTLKDSPNANVLRLLNTPSAVTSNA